MSNTQTLGRNAVSDAGSTHGGGLPQRPYGSKGVRLSIIGFGGIIVKNLEQSYADRLVAKAVDAGVNYFDVAPSYGNSEEHLGPALEPYRKNCFLACKTTRRDAEGARAEMKQSLERLRTDYFDLYQLHSLSEVAKDVDAAFAKGGVMETVIAAKKAGVLRHVGFSAHSMDAALAAMDRYDFDSILFPLNFATFYAGNFGPSALAKAKEKGLSVLALKAMARQKWPADAPDRKQYSKCWYQPLTDPTEQDLALRFTLSQPITAAIPPGEEELFWAAVRIARDFRPITPEETARLQALAGSLDPLFRA